MAELKSGTLLAGRYTLRRRLGAGGGVEVWLAADRATRTELALKVLTGDPAGAAGLRREWQVALRLMHPHIVRVFEFHEPAGSGAAACFSLQYIDGPSIDVLAGAPPEHSLPPIALVADALRYAHGKGMVHRDLKAANILLDANGAPYVIDFGVASAGAERIGGGSLIAASPQQLAGEAPAPADDIFALGGLIYELVSGRSPYASAGTAGEIAARVPPPLEAASGELPAGVRSLVAEMLAKDAGERPDAENVVLRLRAAGIAPGPAPRHYVADARPAGDVVIEASEAYARPRSAPARGAATAPGRGLSPRLVALLLAVLVAALLGVVFLLPQAVEQPPAANETAEPAPAGDEAEAGAEPAEPALPARDERVVDREQAEEVLGRLLAQVKTLEARAVERWGGIEWKRVRDEYAAGDEAYLAGDFAGATDRYEAALEHLQPLRTRVDSVFATALADAQAAFDNGDATDAVRLFELAVAISPGHAGAKAGLVRAQNLDRVLALTEQGLALERNLELDAARDSFARAVEIDPQWSVAADGLARVRETLRQMNFDARMSEGLNALAAGDYASARAAFRVAQELAPESSEPADGLLQVDQAVRLGDIAALEREAQELEAAERWDAAVEAYQKLLELDGNLAFAQAGLARAEERVRLHARLEEFISKPDSLSADRTMQRATQLVVDITRMDDVGPRLADQRDELSRLLKRAATPLTVTLVSDTLTDVSIFKVGKLGAFEQTELELRPGTYVAVGSRPGYRDVRLEFRVAPEIDMEPVVVQCEEPI